MLVLLLSFESFSRPSTYPRGCGGGGVCPLGARRSVPQRSGCNTVGAELWGRGGQLKGKKEPKPGAYS